MKGWSRVALLGTGATICAIATPAFAQAKVFNIPAQPAETAISALGRQAGIQIVAARTFTSGKRTNSVQGAMTAQEALARLLKGTGLRAQRSGTQTYVIVGNAASKANDAGMNGTAPQVDSGRTAPSGDQGVSAQTTASDDATAGGEPADIVVTGVRASLQSAQAIKRNSTQIVDSIAAEDIGKLPDRNVAEALQRIPGIQVQRNFGEGSSVAIRGLTQVRTELNGRDIFTAGGANQLSLEDIPSELLGGVDVYKNPSSDLIEDQLAGTINFRTRKPFDFKGPKFSASVTNSYFDLARRSKPSATLLLSDRWNTGIGEIGVLASVSFQRTAFRQDRITPEPYYTLDQSLNSAGSPVSPTDYAAAAILGRQGQTTTLTHGIGTSEVYGDRRRLGMDFAVQWRPSDTLDITAEVFRNDYKYRYYDYTLGSSTSDAPITPASGVPFSFADNGDFLSGTFVNVPTSTYTSLYERNSVTTDYSLNLKWKPSANLTVTADGQYVDAKTTALRSIVGLSGRADTLFIDTRAPTPVIRIGTPLGVNDPRTFTSAFLLDDLQRSTATDKTARLDAEYRFNGGLLTSVKAGLRYADRSNRSADTGYRYNGLSTVPGTVNVNETDFFRGRGDLFGDFAAFPISTILDYDKTRETVGVTTKPLFQPSGSNQQSFKTYTGYLTAFFNAADIPVPIDGNIGVRVVRTNQNVSGFYQQTPLVDNADGTQSNGVTTFTQTALERSYTNVLPSLNLRAHLAERLQLRLAASKNLSRPTFDQLNPSLTITEPGRSQQAERHVATGGNPNLLPMKSTNFDASLEWYFSRTGSLTLAGFYKNISNYIQTGITRRAITFDNSRTYNFDVTSYTNVATAKVKGAEVAYQQFFDFLPGPLSGLGMQANFTFVDSKAPSPATDGPITNVPLELLSKYNYNLVGIYENGKISGRVAYNWRSKFVETTAGNGTGALPIFDKAFGQLDASVTYNVTPHFSLTVDGTNLTNTMRKTYFGIETRPRDFIYNDRRISGTARITF